MKFTTIVLLLAAFFLFPPTSAADGWSAFVAARVEPDGAFHRGPVQAHVGEPVELTVVLVGPNGDVYADASEVVRRRRGRAPDAPLPTGIRVRWLEVRPHLFHSVYPPPNEGNPVFSNNVLFGSDHGEWLGFDQLEYSTVPLIPRSGTAMAGPMVVVERAVPTSDREDVDGAGSNWFAAEVTLADGTTVRTPDGGDVDRYGLDQSVIRVSFRAGDDYLGWLSTYFNVPSLFGSAGPSDDRHQADRYVGADCADVLVGALRASGQRDAEYTSVSGLHRLADPLTEPLRLDLGGLHTLEGEPAELVWGRDIRPGDLIALNYENDPSNQLPRRWDHIGALARDLGPLGLPNGILDADDEMRHMGALGLRDEPLWSQGGIRIRVWRWSE